MPSGMNWPGGRPPEPRLGTAGICARDIGGDRRCFLSSFRPLIHRVTRSLRGLMPAEAYRWRSTRRRSLCRRIEMMRNIHKGRRRFLEQEQESCPNGSNGPASQRELPPRVPSRIGRCNTRLAAAERRRDKSQGPFPTGGQEGAAGQNSSEFRSVREIRSRPPGLRRARSSVGASQEAAFEKAAVRDRVRVHSVSVVSLRNVPIKNAGGLRPNR